MQEKPAVARNPWWIVLGSVLGLTVGNGPVMQFTFGVFVKPLTAQFASDRGTVSLALTLGLLLTGLCTPVVGHLVDRFGVRAVSLPAITLFALATVSLGFFADSALAFLVIYAIMGVFAAGQTPLPYAKAVSAAFDRQRGLALGVTMAGVGLGTVLLPMFAQIMIGAVGWRGAYVGLGGVLFVVAFPAVLFLLKDGRPMHQRGPAEDHAQTGMTGGEAVRCGSFWLLGAAFFFVALACAGMLAHIVALMTDRGVPAREAAAAISLGGMAMIGGRLLSGWLLDRVFAPHVALVFVLSPLLGVGLLLLTHGAGVAMVATVLVGIGLGAEVDLIAFLISRYLGLRAFGQIYGYLFLAFLVGSALGPFLMGFSFAKTGNYGTTMVGFMLGLGVAATLLMRLGAYRFGGSDARVEPAPARA